MCYMELLGVLVVGECGEVSEKCVLRVRHACGSTRLFHLTPAAFAHAG